MTIEIVSWADPVLPPDLDELVREAVSSGHEWGSEFLPAWQASPFTGNGEALFLAREGGRLLAMAAISADPFVADGITGRLRFIYVRQAARRQGLAGRLVECCMDRAGGRWRRLRLHTDNSIAARLYERYGFRPAANEPRATHVMEVTAS